MNWNETVARARRGDGSAWSELFDRTESMVYYTALKLLKNENEAQDLVQDTYLRAMEHLDSLREAEAFPGWIKRICVNLCKNHLTAKRPLLLGDDKQDFLMSLEPEVQEDFLPHAYADKMETCRLIDRMVDALPEKQRAAVILYYYDELTVAQTADFLQVGENTVKSRLNYARSQIKRQVEELEKKGTKLYSAAPLLALVLQNAATEYRLPLPAASAIRSALELGAAGGAVAAGTAVAGEAAAATSATGGTASGTAAATAGTAAKTGIAAKVAAAGVGTKIAAGVTAAALLAGGAVGIRSATADRNTGKEAAQLVAKVEALGGPEQLLGKSVDEITAYLGEPTYNDGYGKIEYFCGEERQILSLYLVETGECMEAAMASEWFDSLGLDDAAPQEVETILESLDGSWHEGTVYEENGCRLHAEDVLFQPTEGQTKVDGETVYFYYEGPYRYRIPVERDGTVDSYDVDIAVQVGTMIYGASPYREEKFY